MNCHARDAVLRTDALLARTCSNTDSSKGTVQTSADSDSSKGDKADLMHEANSRLRAHQRMEAEEIQRMETEREARDCGDIMSTMLLQMKEQAWVSKRFEEGMKSRRRDIEARSEALAAREAEFRQRQSRMDEHNAFLVKEAAKLKGDKCALNNMYQREKQRQVEQFQAELTQLNKEHEAAIADIQAQLLEETLQREHEHSALLESKRQAEQALEEALGAKVAEVDRWEQRIRDEEGQISLEKTQLKLQAQQLANAQADLAERNRVLDQQEEKLKEEREVQQQFEADGTLSLKMLGTQQRGFREVRLHDIRFSQDSISPVFSDGRSVEQAKQDLMSGSMQVTDFKTIRVVQLKIVQQDIIWSLDNRRLRCMQAAFAKQRDKMIRVKVESLKDEKVKEEFARKFTAGKDIVQRNSHGSTTRKR